MLPFEGVARDATRLLGAGVSPHQHVPNVEAGNWTKPYMASANLLPSTRRAPGSPLLGSRIGEASHPGPKVRVLVANVTALTTGWAKIENLAWDIAFLQETKVAGNERVLGEIKAAGVRYIPGGLDANGVSLVGTLVRTGGAQSVGDAYGKQSW